MLSAIMKDDDLFEEIWNYLDLKCRNPNDGYEWRIVCELLKGIEDRRPRYYELKKRKLTNDYGNTNAEGKDILPINI